ncbi:MAG: hypothetical protein WAL45_14330 [Terracidiphilus sp.]
MKTQSVILGVAIAAMFSAAFAQQSVPPAPADNGPTLAVTMQFIQDRLNEQGKINYTLHAHDSSTNTDWPVSQISIEVTNVIADPATCRITWHKVTTNGGEVRINRDFSLDLRTVQSFETRTSTQEAKAEDNASGPNAVTKTQVPPYFVVTARSAGNVETPFFFSNEDTRNSVAKAMTHAMEMCGGGK